jgi:hypothetical protein
MWEGHLIFGPDLMSYDDLVDVIELIPIFILLIDVSMQRLELGSTWDRHV